MGRISWPLTAFSDYIVRLGHGDAQRTFSTSARPVHRPRGGVDGAVLAFTDVTALVQALAAKDAFLSNVSHELRTPLTSILGYLELLLGAAGLPAQARDGIEIVRRNAQRLERLVGDLLTAASGAIDARRVPSDAAQIVRLAVEAAAPAALASGISLHDATGPGPLHGVLDPVRIAQLMDNLISNAIKYNRPGGSVTVAAARVPGAVQLRVSDTGIGMDEPERRAVFDRFFRSSAARAGGTPGIGLGLAITKAIVEAHEGRIECTSRPGAGTAFTVLIPDPGAGGEPDDARLRTDGNVPEEERHG